MREPDLQITFADLELARQGIRMDPVLMQISSYLDAHPELLRAVDGQFSTGLKNPKTGRPGLTADQALRSLILMRVKNWDYRELAERIDDGYTLRRFTRFYSNPVPKHSAFHRAYNRLTASVIERLNELLIQAAVNDAIEDGVKLRADTMVVETNIHWPTDGTLLWDTVRVLTRLIGKLRKTVPHAVPKFPKRQKAARRLMQKLQRMTAAQRETQQVPAYRKLLDITAQVVAHSRSAVDAIATATRLAPASLLTATAVCNELTHYTKLGDRVIDQAQRRVLDKEQVPAADKLYSIFESHTDLIKRGKANKPVEFGHKVFLAESASGLITQYRVLDGNPTDDNHVRSSLDRHKATFGAAPRVLANDRGFYSEENIRICKTQRVGLACIPQRGGNKTAKRATHEKSAAFKEGQRFRAGIEGTISVLMRGRGMRRCQARGQEHFAVLVGAAVLTNNLMRIARLLLKKQKRRKTRPPSRSAAA